MILLQVKIAYDTVLVSSESITFNNRFLSFPSIILYVAFITVPSYISGWLSKDKGTLMGFIVGLIGCSLPFFITLFLKAETPFSYFEIFSRWFEKATLSSVVGAMSGAAGQLHKLAYNKRVQGTAGKLRRP